ncbi:MAG: integration host factor, actinobacterial type [Bacillota bacterium]|nr:integration host factor, actinobacterial type [Bacillota bacterium]
MALPHLTQEQKMDALKKAQEMRSKRAEVRSKLKSGSLTLNDILASADDEVISRMRVTYLLQSLPQVGKVTTEKIMREIGINENRRVQGLGTRQKEQLLKRLG